MPSASPGSGAGKLPARSVGLDSVPTAWAPARTQDLPVGPPPRIAWTQWDGSRKKAHLGDRVAVVPRFASVFVREIGYALHHGEAGSPGRLVLRGWDGGRTLLARWPDTKVLDWFDTADGEMAWVVADDEGSGATGGLLTRDGCVADIEIPRGAEMLGFAAPGDLAMRVPNTGRSGPPKQLVRSSGLPVSWPGVAEDYFAVGIVFSPQRRLVAAPEAATGAVRAYDADRSRGLWANAFPAPERYAWLPQAFSPSGRRLLLAAGTELLVVDSRTGQPLCRLMLPPSADPPAFEDEQHVVFRDDGVPEGHRELPQQHGWVVRCSFDGRCERATVPDPADGPDDVVVLAGTR